MKPRSTVLAAALLSCPVFVLTACGTTAPAAHTAVPAAPPAHPQAAARTFVPTPRRTGTPQAATGGIGIITTAKQSLIQQFTTATDGSQMTTAQATCFASTIVNSFGVAKLQKYHLIDASGHVLDTQNPTLTNADAATMAETFVHCYGPTQTVAMFKKLLASEVEASGLPTKYKDCALTKITPGFATEVLTNTFAGNHNSELMGAEIGMQCRQYLTPAQPTS